MKKIISIILILAMLMPTAALAADDEIKVFLDGERIEFDVQPIIENERTLVPIRAIAEALGATVEWKSPLITMEKDRRKIEINIGNTELLMTDYGEGVKNTLELDVPAKIVNERAFVPLRAIYEIFDCEVVWDERDRIVNIGYVENLNFTEKEYSLLEDRLSISLPDNADDHSHGDINQTFIIINVGTKDCEIRATELLKTSVGDLKKDAENLGFTVVGDVIRQNKLEILEVNEKKPYVKNKQYLTRLDDDFLALVMVSMNTTNTELFESFSNSVIKTLKRGVKNLDINKGMQEMSRLIINKPQGYVVYENSYKGEQNSIVYTIQKVMPSDIESVPSILIFEGVSQSYDDGYNEEKDKTISTVKGEFLGKEITWQLCKSDNYMQAWYKGNDQLYYHIIAHPENEEQCKEFIDIVSNIRKCSAAGVGGKPVIYLYPEIEQEVLVTLDLDGKFIFTYPEYKNGWKVTAKPDGTIISDGKEYSYLFWEGEMPDFEPDFKEGFVVKGSDSAEFLREKLSQMGLTPKEYNEFIVYWAPKMQENEYNKIYFAKEEYEQAAKLKIIPEPDSVLRVFMVYEPATVDTVLPKQEIKPFERKGFTVVEWGGYLKE